jgi:DNA topoisomerase IA
MAKNLVIIEAPNKAKKIKSCLGDGYDVRQTRRRRVTSVTFPQRG